MLKWFQSSLDAGHTAGRSHISLYPKLHLYIIETIFIILLLFLVELSVKNFLVKDII